MSSPDRASAERKPAAAPRAGEDASQAALALAGVIEKGLADGDLNVVSQEAQQALMTALTKLYGANSEAGERYTIVSHLNAVTSTDVMVACAALLKSANLQAFELGMWQSWTGR
jgi:hypothetical protein